MKSHQVLIFSLGIAIACGSRTPLRAADDWISKSGPKILIMPKSVNSADFVPYSDIIPQLVRDEKKPEMTIYDFAWPLSASKEIGQWLQIEDGGSMSRHPRKCWINTGQLTKLDAAAAQYNEQIQKKATGSDARAYHWLLGAVLEQQQQNAAARFQYQQAFAHNASDMTASRAKWGFARLSADLFSGDRTGVDNGAFRTSVDDNFKGAACSENDVPGFYVDWGQALEKALPDSTQKVIDHQKFIDQLSDTTTGIDTSYPDDVIIPNDHPGDVPPESQPFKGIRHDVSAILSKYYCAETHRRPALCCVGRNTQPRQSDMHQGNSGPPQDRGDEDASSWDVPHRLIGSLYARYAMKRNQEDFNDLYIDVDGVKSSDEAAGTSDIGSSDTKRTVTADDEFVRALRRNANSRETHDERAKLYFEYFKLAHSNSVASAGLRDVDGAIRVAKQHYKDDWSAKRTALLIVQATQKLARRRMKLIAQYNKIKDLSDPEAEKLANAIDDQNGSTESGHRTTSGPEAAASNYESAEYEWENVLGSSQRALKRIELVSLRLGNAKRLHDMVTYASAVSFYAPPVKTNWDKQYESDVTSWADSKSATLRNLREELLAFDSTRSTTLKPDERYFWDQLSIFADPKKASAIENALWEIARNEAIAAAEQSTYRNGESLDLLARISYARELRADPSEQSLPENYSRSRLPTRPLLADAVRYESRAVEYTRDETKLLDYQFRYGLWWNEFRNNPLRPESIISVEPTYFERMYAKARENSGVAAFLAEHPGVADDLPGSNISDVLDDNGHEISPVAKLYSAEARTRDSATLQRFPVLDAKGSAGSAPAAQRGKPALRASLFIPPPPTTDWSGFSTP